MLRHASHPRAESAHSAPDSPHLSSFLHQSEGLTLIELLIAMALSVTIVTAAFGVMRATSQSVLHTQERANAQQRGRVALENLMVALHSGCVAPSVTPIRIAPVTNMVGESMLRFISQESSEPQLTTVTLHEIEYLPAKSELVEKQYESESSSSAPNWTFPSKPKSTRQILTHIRKATSASGAAIPVFQYYRYYTEGEGSKTYGELRPTAMDKEELEKEGKQEEEEVTKGEGRGNEVAKVTVTFAVGSQAEYKRFEYDLAATVSDSAVFRVDADSTTPGKIDVPCT